MKRKIIVVAMLMTLIACLFAIVTSAAEIPEWTDITEVEGMSDKSVFGDDGKKGATSRVLMSDGATYPAYYICKDSETLGIDLATLNTKANKAYTKTDIVRIEIPKGIRTVSTALSGENGYTSLVSVVIPLGVEVISAKAFRSSNIVGELVIPEGCKEIGASAFRGASITKVTLPSTLESVAETVFKECSSLTEVVSNSKIIGEDMFYDCDALSSITLRNTITIGARAFLNPSGGTLNITELSLPEGLTSIGESAFARAKITTLILPSTLTSIGKKAFSESTTLKKVVALNTLFGEGMFYNCSALNELVLTEKFVNLNGSTTLQGTPQTSFITYYTGADHERIKTVCADTTRLSQAKYYSYEDYQDENYTYNKYMVIYGANLCEVAFDGEHDYQGTGYCVDGFECSMCPKVIDGTDGHDIVKTIEYANGFAKAGTICEICENDRCEYIVSSEAPAIFECLGYSVNSDNTGIATGFLVNAQSLDEYEKFIGKELTFGVVIFNPKYLGNDTLFTQDGKINASKGALQVEFDLEYSICNLSVSGMSLENSAHASLELVFAGYAYEGEDVGSAKVFQKEYIGTTEAPISSPMASKVTRGSDVLYTIKLQSVLTPAQISFGKEGLNEF